RVHITRQRSYAQIDSSTHHTFKEGWENFETTTQNAAYRADGDSVRVGGDGSGRGPRLGARRHGVDRQPHVPMLRGRTDLHRPDRLAELRLPVGPRLERHHPALQLV